jgi:hypothetical protein
MALSRILSALPILMIFLMVAGCTTTSVSENRTASVSTPNISSTVILDTNSTYPGTYPPSENSIHSDFIKMDFSVYNRGEVIEFYLVNEGTETLACNNTPPTFSIFRQTGNSSWEIQSEFEETKVPAISYLKPGESTRTQRITTTNLLPGRYMIVYDCGVLREFEIRSL